MLVCRFSNNFVKIDAQDIFLKGDKYGNNQRYNTWRNIEKIF